MPYTVEGAFTAFHDAINLKGDHRETANARRDRVQSLLASQFEILEAFASGSIPRFTALRGHSDVDVMVALHYGKHIKNKTPAAVLKSVRDALGAYRTNVRRNGQAVTLYYDTWPNVDVVPVSRVVDSNSKVTHYEVPNEVTGQWIPSNPKTHSDNIEERSSICGQNFRRIIKMMKAWNLAHGEYLQSYHIEVLALKIYSSNLDDTAWQIFQFFEKSRLLLETALIHGNGLVDGYLDYADRQEVLKRFDTAIEKSRDAWYLTYGERSDHQTAIGIWRTVFGDQFPAYG